EIATLAAWVDGGTPEGDPKDAPAPRKFNDGWQLGKPDLILGPKEDFTLAATGRDQFRCFVLPTEQAGDKLVAAYEMRARNGRIVHRRVHFLDPEGRARRIEQRVQEREKTEPGRDSGPGYSSMMGPGFFPPTGDLGGWAPGISPSFLPDGVGYYLPRES